MDDEIGTKHHKVSSTIISPDKYIEKKERIKQVQDAIANLNSDQRSVIILRDIEGCSYEEVAKITGHKLGTVKSKLSRAREGLRKMLEGTF